MVVWVCCEFVSVDNSGKTNRSIQYYQMYIYYNISHRGMYYSGVCVILYTLGGFVGVFSGSVNKLEGSHLGTNLCCLSPLSFSQLTATRCHKPIRYQISVRNFHRKE